MHEHAAKQHHSYSVDTVEEPFATIFQDHFLFQQHGMIDEYIDAYPHVMAWAKKIVLGSDYGDFFEFLQFLLRHKDSSEQFSRDLDAALSRARSAYRVVDKWTIAPFLSIEEGAAIAAAFEATRKGGFAGTRKHLSDASEAATAGQWAVSINASIDSVEAVCKAISGESTISKALEVLAPQISMHKALKAGLQKIYDFTSNEKGLRHSLADLAKANVDEHDAMLMLGTCAAFVSYLIARGRGAGLLS